MLKKISIILLLFTFSFLIFEGVFALSNKQKWIILEKFKINQEEFIFENNIDVNSLDALNLFEANSKISIYENVLKNVWKQRSTLQEENLKIAEKINDLQFQLKSLENDINLLDEETKKINSNIVKTTVEITKNKYIIEEVKQEIEKNSEILRGYIAYIYKKWNLFLNDSKLDNFKAIILSGENLDSVINDIYFKEILAVAWRELIEKNRKFVFDLYIERKNLEEETVALKKLKKNFILKKKIFNDKKQFKKKILEISKWKDALYKKYIKEKVDIEKWLKLKSFAERIKFYSTSKKVLAKSGCIFTDVSKNTPETRTLSKKCYSLNKIIFLEAKLEENKVKQKSKESYNSFAWPVSPYMGISSYFHDSEYKKEFNSEHKWVDIIVPQWTDIVAPKDWYVIALKKPTDNSYSFLALKHEDWNVTIYGHINEALVNKYDYVKTWEIIAKSWWIFWTLWAWYVTTWAHLHFELFKDKVNVDPLKSMDLSYLNFKMLPDYYRLDFFIDYREKTWKEYLKKEEFTWKRFSLDWNTEIERQKSLLNKYARNDFNNWTLWVEESLRWNIDPTLMMCIWLAESWLWMHLKTLYNVWNVWNVDSGWTWSMDSPRLWIWWIGHTLNNRYLKDYNEISRLSWYGRIGNDPIYASDPINWHRNVVKCMSTIKGQYIADDYNFRTY